MTSTPSIFFAAFFVLTTCAWLSPASAFAADLSRTGHEDARLSPLDNMMLKFMQDHKVPGASVAVARGGKVIYARGFGYSDVEAKELVQPNSLFRIASITKPITAVAVFQLIEQGKLKLDQPAFAILDLKPHLENGATFDERHNRITIRQLLQHTGGWDRDKAFDPMFRSIEIAKSLGVNPPAEPVHIIRYMLGRQLDFDPGTRYAYSNLGYCILGRIIEKLTGQTYDQYIQQNVLTPIGITDMRLGRTLLKDRADREVKYYPSNDGPSPAVVGPKLGEMVPEAYGGWYHEALDAHGGWIGSASDLVTFAAAFDDPAHCKLLKADSIEQMWSRPPGAPGKKPHGSLKDSFYACGWSVRPAKDGKNATAWHTGKLSGSTSAILVRRADGLSWDVLFNADADSAGKDLAGAIDPLVHKAIDSIHQWPEN